MRKIEKNCKKLGKIEKNWEKLGKIGKNWEKLGKIGKIWEKIFKVVYNNGTLIVHKDLQEQYGIDETITHEYDELIKKGMFQGDIIWSV